MSVSRFPFVKFPAPKDKTIPPSWQELLERLDRLEAKRDEKK